MILKGFDDYVVVDSMIEEYDKDCEYFCSSVAGISAPQLHVKINTTAKIARGMEVYNKEIRKDCFNILKENEIHRILLCTGTEIAVEVFPTLPSQEHVMFFFENLETSTKVLYTGTCTTAMLRSIIRDPHFRRRIADGVDYLYIDNARVASEHFPSVQEVGLEIVNILRSNSNYRILLHSPILWYEELLYHLVQQRQIKVCIPSEMEHLLNVLEYPKLKLSNKKDAKIIYTRAIFSYEGIKSLFQENIVNVRFTEAMLKPKNLLFEQSGIYEINWSPNLNYYDFVTFVRMVAPKEVHGLSYECILPDDIKQFIQIGEESQKSDYNSDTDKTVIFELPELPSTQPSDNNAELEDSIECDTSEYSMKTFCDRTIEDQKNDFSRDELNSPSKEKNKKQHQPKDTTNLTASNVEKPKKKLRGPLSRRKKRSSKSNEEVIEGSPILAKIPLDETQSDEKRQSQKDSKDVTKHKIPLEPTIIIKKENKLRGPLCRRKKRSSESEEEVIEESPILAKIPSAEPQSDEKSNGSTRTPEMLRSVNLVQKRKCNLYRRHAGEHVTYVSSDSDEPVVLLS